MTAEENERLLKTQLTYQPGHGTESLRQALAAMYGAKADEIQIVTGASEALLALFFLAAEPGANVVLPYPAFPPFLAIPESFGLEVRRYNLDAKNGSAFDLERVRSLVDDRTKLVLVNSPHNPTGSVVSESDVRALEELTSKRGVQLVVDEVYHPIYRTKALRSAGEYTRATILGDFSKAFSLSGIRVGWILERDPKRREDYWNARAHFSISNNFPGELLAEVAVRNRKTIFDRAREVAASNLYILDRIFREHREILGWVRPEGGMTAFPWLVSGENARPFCEAAASKGVLLAPGDCFGFPSHFRLGFGACAEGYEKAVEILSGTVAAVS
jgi:aspartate/methionine/tyrosine aminotransferase